MADKDKKQSMKEAIQNINRTGTVSGQSSGVSNISGKIVKDTTNSSNLAGVDYQKNAPTVKTGSNPTGINTNASNLAGVNYQQQTPKTSQKSYNDVYVQSSSNPQYNPVQQNKKRLLYRQRL